MTHAWRRGRWPAGMAIAVLLAMALTGPVEADQPSAADARPHSGLIVSAGSGAITLEEIGPWSPADAGIARHAIAVKPTTTVVQATRSHRAAAGQWPGGFTATPLTASDLRPGEYAVVVTRLEHGHLVAREITIVPITTEQEAGKP